MAKDLSFSTFLDEYDTDFFDYLSKTSTACHSETRYKELTEKIKTLYEQYPNVRKVLDVDRPCELSAEMQKRNSKLRAERGLFQRLY